MRFPPSAFAPFYTERLAVTAKRDGRTLTFPVRAAAFDDGFAERYDEEGSAESSIRAVSFHVPRSGADGWSDRQPPPAVGDRVVWRGAAFSVARIDALDTSDFILQCREAPRDYGR